jgi:hypothetical protein
VRAPGYVANFDSAAAMLRALARFLHGKDFPALGVLRPLTPLAPLVDRLPPAAYRWSGAIEGIGARRLGSVSAERIARWAVGLYPARRYPAVALGSSNGAAVHLCAALGIPWLPQTFFVPVRHGGAVDVDDAAGALAWGRAHAPALLEVNPELQLHHMHDPVQDRLMLARLAYFRVKRLRLGETFERFIARSLPPGGTILVLDCTRTWPTTRVSERHLFQAGALGGATEDEYHRGGERVAAFLRREGAWRDRWATPVADGRSPESEWGFEASLLEDVERLAASRGYRLRRLTFAEPEHLSPAVADLYRSWYDDRGLASSRLLVESFIVLDPWWTLRTGSVPFWTKFPVETDADFLERYLDRTGAYRDVRVMLFSHGVDSIGLADAGRWRAVIARAAAGGFAGVDAARFPRDFAVYLRYNRALRSLAPLVPLPTAPLPLDALGEVPWANYRIALRE